MLQNVLLWQWYMQMIYNTYITQQQAYVSIVMFRYTAYVTSLFSCVYACVICVCRRLYWRLCNSVMYSSAHSQQQPEAVSSDPRHLPQLRYATAANTARSVPAYFVRWTWLIGSLFIILGWLNYLYVAIHSRGGSSVLVSKMWKLNNVLGGYDLIVDSR